MQEALDLIVSQIRGAWRFRRYALIAAWIVAPLGWIAIFALPDVYQASSRVFVDTKTALKPALKDLVLDQDVNGQLNLVRQSLLAGPQLEPVAQEVGLIDTRIMTPQQRLRILNDIRDRVTIDVSLAGGQQDETDRDAGSIYSIQYEDVSRERAVKLVEVLQNNLIEKTLGGKRSGSESAQKFLEAQIRDDENRLRQAEERLAAFKKSNVGLMPTEQGGYFMRLQTEMDAVTEGQSRLAIATSRRDELQRQLRGEAPVAAAAGVSSAPTASGAAGGSGGDTLSRIAETQARLDDLLLRFTDKHPDVIAQRDTLEALKQRREAEVAALRRGDPNAAAASGASRNPVYQSIQLALNEAEVEIASLRRQVSDHQGKVAELRKMLDTMPQVEAEFARLNRDYDVTRARYTALVERLEKSRLGEEAATSGSVRFDVIEPPNAGFKPISPKRSILVLATLVVAIGFGAAIAFLMHQLKPVFNSARGLTEATGLQVLGAVSMIWVDEVRANEKRAYVRYGVALLGLFVVGAVVLQMSRMGIRLGPQPGA
ncbi:chain-length determining protein [Steroidobacter agaridevorans]|uniref:Chain-length determining protein n=1 Tax=Steroidobacter agaridevorans TaxID=2695856 RepID=A0A829YH38_9GAMM|nr:XrtA system polysaccharide chain length determinant [Steroidobacter agaridevorans]GFE82141.1 chain-length determining protein [Steroidobacter agaridevorans]GFE85471.1 chain-length determining protein [Steroidobacter agaridevorans]